MSERNLSSGTHGAWDEADERFRRLTPSEAAALRAKNPQLSPWRVIVAQAAVGGVVALLAWLLGGGREHAWSALYGAVTAVCWVRCWRAVHQSVSSCRRRSASAPRWGVCKIGATVVLLVAGAKLVRPLCWPALLAALAACVSVYWFALLWRGRKS